MKLMVVDDDTDLVDMLHWWLSRAGFEIQSATDLATARALLAAERPSLLLLDILLGDASGLDLLTELRGRGDVLPVILLTANNTEEEKVRGLDLGADDYITKPFSHRELTARVNAVLRRYGQGGIPVRGPEELTAGGLTLYPAEHRATLDGEELSLTVLEYRLLHFLMTNRSSVVSTPTLLKHVWGWGDASTSSASDTVRVTIHRLRRKLRDDPVNPRLLHTVPGVGFMLKPQKMRDTSRV